jgi:hypothetical protein
MLPAYRTEGQEDTLPPFALARSDVEGFLHELRGFHEAFRLGGKSPGMDPVPDADATGSRLTSAHVDE